MTVEVKINDHGVFQRLTQVFPYVADEAIPLANQALIEGIKIYPPYSYVSMEQAGGWRSERQRRFVMASIRSGAIKIPYSRTYQLQNAWTTEGEGRAQIIINGTPYAVHVYGPPQAFMMSLRNWPLAVSGGLQLYMAGVMNAVREGIDVGLHKLGLK